MVRDLNNNISHFFTTPHHSQNSYATGQKEEEEFDEDDILWSDTNNNNNSNIKVVSKVSVTNTNTVNKFSYVVPTSLTGISAALLTDNEPRSPTSIQRKTTSSPVAMIPSSLLVNSTTSNNVSRSGGSTPGSYYGRKCPMSAPVNVPVWPNRYNSGPIFGSLGPFDDEEVEEETEEDGKILPPHKIVARSHKTTSFSVFEGAGRTLKGRDLTAVRNAVFQKTGFLD